MLQEPQQTLQPTNNGYLLHVYAVPKASRTQISGLYGNRLKIQITSPPIDGKANEALIKFLAQTLNTAKSNISLHTGHTSKRKSFLIQHVEQQTITQALALNT